MSELNVLYPFDDNYAPYAGVSITSLLENNKAADSIHLFILGFDLTDDTVAKLRKTVERYDRTITFIGQDHVDNYIMSLDMPSYRGARIAAARLFVTQFIPSGIDRLLYLDSDTIITGDITGLMNTDLSGNPVGMVCDSVARDYKVIMGFEPGDDYFNGGMIVYDLNEWKKQSCSERIEEHIRNVRRNYEALDQDLINIVLKGSIKKLDPRFNLQPFHVVYPSQTYLKVYGNGGYYDADTINMAKKSAVILHAFRYLGMFPWHMNTLHPCADEFSHYKEISEWKDMPPVQEGKQPLTIRIERIARRLLPKVLFLRLFRTVFSLRMKSIENHLRTAGTYTNI